MSATEELRRLLDERGVEWRAADSQYAKETCWSYMSKLTAAFTEYGNGTTRCDCDTWCFTPEQAVEATLGRGACEVEGYDDGMDDGMDGEWYTYGPPTWYLSCGHETHGSTRPRYCSACGARVVSGDGEE